MLGCLLLQNNEYIPCGYTEYTSLKDIMIAYVSS